MQKVEELIEQYPDFEDHKGLWSGNIITILGTITMTQRGIFKSHMGDGSNRSSVDKQIINGTERAELRGIKVITKMRDNLLFDLRDLIDELDAAEKTDIFYAQRCRKNNLCGNCPSCKLFGSLRAGKFSRRSRLIMPDMFSTEDAESCISGYLDPDEEGVLNTVESPDHRGTSAASRGSASFATYEYVRPDTEFPFKIIIRDPSKYDIFGAIKSLNDVSQIDGVGTYSSRNGRFKATIRAISSGFPLAGSSNADIASDPEVLDNPEQLFDDQGMVISLSPKESEDLVEMIYEKYFDLLENAKWDKVINKPVSE